MEESLLHLHHLHSLISFIRKQPLLKSVCSWDSQDLDMRVPGPQTKFILARGLIAVRWYRVNYPTHIHTFTPQSHRKSDITLHYRRTRFGFKVVYQTDTHTQGQSQARITNPTQKERIKKKELGMRHFFSYWDSNSVLFSSALNHPPSPPLTTPPAYTHRYTHHTNKK